jgi:hypothetical protein
MDIEDRRFMELAIHVKLASEAVLSAARNLAAIRVDPASEATAWQLAMEGLVAMNAQLGFMERILRDAAHGEVALPRAGRNGRSVTQ